MKTLTIHSGIAQIHPDTDPLSIRNAIAANQSSVRVIQFYEDLPRELLDVLKDILKDFPEIALRAYSFGPDPSLKFLNGFEHIKKLSIDIYEVESFEPISNFTNLIVLSLGKTKSKNVSLKVLENFKRLETLYIGGHSKDFGSVALLKKLKFLSLVASRVKSLQPLSFHSQLKSLWISLGGIRDLTPLPTIPNLQELSFHRIRLLNERDLSPLSKIIKLYALQLQDLRNVKNLGFLKEGNKIRFLELDVLKGLESFSGIEKCTGLECLGIFKSQPLDKDLLKTLKCEKLKEFHLGDFYHETMISEFIKRYKGNCFCYRGKNLKGSCQYDKRFIFWDIVKQSQL